MTRAEFHKKAYFFLFIFIAFFLPVHIRFVPLLIVLLTINWISEGKFQEKLSHFKGNRIAWLFIAFYLLHFLGMFWSDNTSAGWFDLQVKLSFLIFPLIFATTKWMERELFKWTLWSFVFGCLFNGLICFLIALFHFFRTGENHFAYTDYAYNLHPSYFALYCVFAISVVLFKHNYSSSIYFKIKDLLLIIFLVSTVILLSSKIGTISLFMLIITYVFYCIIKIKKWLIGFFILSFTFLTSFIIFHYLPYTENRIKDAIYWTQHVGEIDKEHTASDAARILIWKADIQVIESNYFFGTGTGDIKDELLKKYEELGYKEIFERKLNAHNQFFQTTAALGIFGGGMLLLIFASGFIFSVRNKLHLFLSFIFLTFLNFIVESMLEVQAGVIFFNFFYFILLQQNDSTE